MPQMGDNKLRARMMTLASALWTDTQLEDMSDPAKVEGMTKDAVELTGLLKVFLIRAHDQRLTPYSRKQQEAIQDALKDNRNVTSHEKLWDDYVSQACERRNKA